jgi:hypothetical protein
MTFDNENNPFGLTPEELKVLAYWQQGNTQIKAYKKVMLTTYEKQNLKETAIVARSSRFFNTYRMRAAMAATPGERGEKARKEFEKWQALMPHDEVSQAEKKAMKKIIDESNYSISDTVEPMEEEDKTQEIIDSFDASRNINLLKKGDRDQWIESLNVNKDPSAMTVYGSGQYLMYVAVKELMERQKEIKRKNLSVLDKDGSALTPNIINAFKTATSMILPFAPPPTNKERRELSKAAVLLGLLPDSITENPADFAAPIPPTVEVEVESNNNGNEPEE